MRIFSPGTGVLSRRWGELACMSAAVQIPHSDSLTRPGNRQPAAILRETHLVKAADLQQRLHLLEIGALPLRDATLNIDSHHGFAVRSKAPLLHLRRQYDVLAFPAGC